MGARKERQVFFYRDSEGAFETESVSRGGSSWSPWREGARRKVSFLFFYWDSEGAFGAQSAIRGGSIRS